MVPAWPRLPIVAWAFLLAMPALAEDTPNAQVEQAECVVEVQSHGTYYDPIGGLGYSLLPAQGVSALMKALLFGAKQATNANSRLDGRGIMTARFTMEVKVTRGRLAGPVPPARNFTTPDNLGEAGHSAFRIAEDYAKKAGCAKVTVKQVPSTILEAARSSTFSRLRLILAGLLNFVADASEPKAPSLKDARDDFEKSSNRLALAIASFSQSGCVRTDQVNKLLQQAGPQAASVAGHVKKNLDHLNTAVGSPMKMDEAGACQGSFTTMTRELELRIGEVTGSRKNLAQAGQKQLDLLNTLSNVDQYDVKDAKCGGRAFAGFRDSVSQAFIALDGMNKIAIALSGTETEMKAQREKHRSLLARCGQNQEAGLRSASGKARSETGREKSPRGTSQKAGSDITGVQEDGAKQKQP